MKGVILSLPVRNKSKHRFSDFSLGTFLRKNSASLLFTLFFTFGVVWGACTALKAEDEFVSRMDFLFTTNLSSRLSMGMFSSFTAHFASNFLFFTAAVLCGLSVWGAGALPLVTAFKGFGTGLSGAYLISAYGLKGIGFYIFVVLPGTFVFSLALIFLCSESTLMSLQIAKSVFTKNHSTASIHIKTYLLRCLWFLFLSVAGALCDMFFWSFVSKMFF